MTPSGAPSGEPRGAPRVGITLGDPAGIGPEVAVAALREREFAGVRFSVYGDLDAAERAGGLPGGVQRHRHASAAVEPGAPRPEAAAGVVEAIRAAAGDALRGALDAVVTGPISKAVLAGGGFAYPGHTELLQELAGGGPAVMLLVGGQLRVALATVHCPLREVPGRLSREGLEGVLGVLDADLRRRFGLAQPRIAVCGLNPHAGEEGRFGDEEARVIAPAVQGAAARGIAASGPYSADSLFARAIRGEFDAVLGMYHDQALGPLKVHAFGRAVNVTLGLPLIRTSVDHGTAFDLAGRGRADAGSMVEAIRTALELVQRARGAEGESGAGAAVGGSSR